jgi:putative phosphoesterase
MKIGIISDTHGKIHPRALEMLAEVDHILHAGDIGGEHVLETLRRIAPVTAVGGNVDGFQCGEAGPVARVNLGGLRFFITHIIDRPSRLAGEVGDELRKEDADVVVFGHSHLPHNEKLGGRWYFNPASAGPRRFDYPVSIGFFEKRTDGWTAWHAPLDERSEGALEKYMNQL